MTADNSHARWARATREHVDRARKILLAHIEYTGRPLPGGVTADLVTALPNNDLLDLAYMMANWQDGGVMGLHAILAEARTLPTPGGAASS